MRFRVGIFAAASAALLLGTAPAASAAGEFTGTDTTEPTYTISSPARGEFVSGAAQVTVSGTADDGESGVASVEVNGQHATLNGNQWSLPATLEFGTNIYRLKVVDNAGNEAHTSWAALYSPTYLPDGELVPNAAATRLSEASLNQIAPIVIQQIVESGALQQAIVSVPGSSLPGHVNYYAVTFDPPHVSIVLAQGAFHAAIDIPNLVIDADFAGGSLDFAATNAHVEGDLLVGVTNGQFVVSMPETPSVTLTDFVSHAPRAPKGLAADALAVALQTALPPAIDSALNAATQPRTFTYPLGTMTTQWVPRSLSIEPAGVTTAMDGDVFAPASPNVPPAPGSVFTAPPAGSIPGFANAPGFFVALNENMVNRALFSSWQAGFWDLRIDQAFLTRFGINLPIPLDANFIIPFFPALASLAPPGGGPMPLAFEVNPLLPPVATVGGAPSLLTATVGELHLSIQVDFGQGYQDILTVALHVEGSADVDVLCDRLRLTLGRPTTVVVDLLQNPLGLAQPDVDRFLDVMLPSFVQFAGAMIPPIPLPSLLPCPLPQSIDVRQDTTGADFLVVEGDV